MNRRITVITLALTTAVLAACTLEQQNQISRDIQNWTGTNGVPEV
jgi:outer membrane biogenesis lipoprotein LolB